MPVEIAGLRFTKQPNGDYIVMIAESGAADARFTRSVIIPSAAWTSITGDAVGSAKTKLTTGRSHDHGGSEAGQ